MVELDDGFEQLAGLKNKRSSDAATGEDCNNNTSVFLKGIWEKYDIGSLASGVLPSFTINTSLFNQRF